MLSKIQYININDYDDSNIIGIDGLTLSTIMAEDCSVHIATNKDKAINIIIEDENDSIIVNEEIHPYAADSLAYFCRQYLAHYENVRVKS